MGKKNCYYPIVLLAVCICLIFNNGLAGDSEGVQGNSAGIVYDLQPVTHNGERLSDRHSISYNSETNELTIRENSYGPQEIFPFGLSTDITPGEPTGSGVINPGIDFATLSYSALFEQRSGGYAWRYNYPWSSFQTELTTLGNQGFRIENLDTYGFTSVFNYAGTWTMDGQGWSWALNYSNVSDFVTLLNNWPLGTTRYRPIDFAIHPNLNSNVWYGAVAVADNVGFVWLINETNFSAFTTWITNQYSSSRRLVDLEMYRNPAGGSFNYAGISESGTYQQTVWINQDWATFLSTHNTIVSQGGRLIDYAAYSVDQSDMRYAGLWNYDGVGSGWVLNYLDQNNFNSQVNSQVALGRLPIMIEVYDRDEILDIGEPGEITHQVNVFELDQNYPNPFNPATTIKFALPVASDVMLKIYNTLGEEISTLVSRRLEAGTHEYVWDASHLPSGIYVSVLQTDDGVRSRKMILMK